MRAITQTGGRPVTEEASLDNSPTKTLSELAFAAGGWRFPLPARSQALFVLNRLLNASPIDLREVAEVVRGDLGLTAQVLRLAYSELAAEEEQRPTLESALVLLGVRTLRSQVLTAPLVESVAPRSRAADLAALWDHSLMTARLAQRMCEASAYFDAERGYLAALLHDIGKISALLNDERESGAEAGGSIDHCLRGSRWAATWRLPAFFLDVIENHHQVENAKHEPALVAIVAAADAVAHLWGFELNPGVGRTFDRAALMEVFHRYLPTLNEGQCLSLIERFARDYAVWVEPLPASAAMVQSPRAAGIRDGKEDMR